MRGTRSPADPVPGLAGATFGDFWAWACSNLLENTVRPAFAEFIVGTLLGVESDGRKVWDAVDLKYGAHGVEVKASAYVQAWDQARPSRIEFDIARKRGWRQATNTYSTTPERAADCYVFCLYPEKDRQRADPAQVDAWRFWVLPTARIDAAFGDQKRVSLGRLEALTSAVSAATLRATVDAALDLKRAE